LARKGKRRPRADHRVGVERPRHLSEAQRERMVRALWARVAVEDLHCRGLCHDSCGAIGYSTAERKVIQTRHGAFPVPQGELRGGKFEHPDDIMCSALTPDKRCSIYDERPAICRLYGLIRELPCAHGCVPRAWMTHGEAQTLIAELDAIEGKDERSHYLASIVALAARRRGIVR
jgi:Fe-S-cluster containining protein